MFFSKIFNLGLIYISKFYIEIVSKNLFRLRIGVEVISNE